MELAKQVTSRSLALSNYLESIRGVNSIFLALYLGIIKHRSGFKRGNLAFCVVLAHSLACCCDEFAFALLHVS